MRTPSRGAGLDTIICERRQAIWQCRRGTDQAPGALHLVTVTAHVKRTRGRREQRRTVCKGRSQCRRSAPGPTSCPRVSAPAGCQWATCPDDDCSRFVTLRKVGVIPWRYAAWRWTPVTPTRRSLTRSWVRPKSHVKFDVENCNDSIPPARPRCVQIGAA